MIQKIRAEVRRFFSLLKPMPTVAFVVAGLALWIYEYYGSTFFFGEYWAPRLGVPFHNVEAGGYFYWFGSAFVLLALAPWLLVRATSYFTPDDAVPTMGWGLGDWRFGLAALAICLPVMLVIVAVVALTPGFQDAYPLFPDADRSMQMLIAYELAYAFYFVAWEFFFRGFMTFSLQKTLGIHVIFVQMLPFTVMHFGKPSLEAMSSIFGGVALGYIALRSRSIWYGVAIHAGTAVAMDLMALLVKSWVE